MKNIQGLEHIRGNFRRKTKMAPHDFLLDFLMFPPMFRKLSRKTILVSPCFEVSQEKALLFLVAIGLESLFVLVLADLLFSLFYDTAHN